MCGIAGILSFYQALPIDRIQKMVHVLRHRGPDLEKYWSDQHVQLGHCRLKVIDLSEEASQPMGNEDGTLWLVFNGEIYNFQELRKDLIKKGHSFRSQGDSEVLLHLYEEEGEQCVDKLDGMFAFAIWDRKKKEIFLARDRSGKKPLYYYLNHDLFAFSSEIKSFFQIPEILISLNEDKLPSFFLRGHLSFPETLYKNIWSLEAGSFLKIPLLGQKKYQRYWDWVFPIEKRKISLEEVKEEISILFHEAVKKRLISDVPLGAFLSGGIDSTIVVGAMKKILNQQIKTFSVGFEGDARYDETHYAKEAASYFDTDHTVLKIKASDLVDHFDQILWHYDGPFSDSSALPCLMVSFLASQHVTVALNGDGGDELFMGYERLAAAYYSSFVPSWVFKAGRNILNLLPFSYHERSKLSKVVRLFQGGEGHPLQSLSEWLYVFKEDELRSLFKQDFSFLDHQHEDYRKALALSHSLDQLQYFNFKQYLQNDLNVKMDRASMAYGLETRSPFLDQKLTEYVAYLPHATKLKGFKMKSLLKDIFKEYLPLVIQKRGKQGFGVPLSTWFRNDLKDFVSDYLLTTNPAYQRFLNKEVVCKILNEHFSGKKERSQQIWLLLNFERWLQKLPSWSKNTL